jgi:hypothetical protein
MPRDHKGEKRPADAIGNAIIKRREIVIGPDVTFS